MGFQLLYVLQTGLISHEGDGAQFGCCFFNSFFPSSGNDHLCAFIYQCLCCGIADATVPAGYYCQLIGKSFHFLNFNAKLWRWWYNFVTSIIKYTTSMYRDQSEEYQALQDTLYVIGGKWRIPIINSICNGNTRFREIERSIPGITRRMLSRELKDMELNKLVKRTVYAGPPVQVEYESTEYCKSFGGIILEMIRWGREHRKVVTKKRNSK